MLGKSLLLVITILGTRASVSQAYPCPEVDDIAPCVCTEETTTPILDLDCSEITDDAELEKVFSAYFPFHTFNNFTMISYTTEPRINVRALKKDTFKNITFANIRISHTNLEEIDLNVFDNSAPTLKTLIVTDSFLPTFPFDMLAYAPVLEDLRVFRNKIVHMSNLHSESLKYLQISYNPGLTFEDQAFWNAPNLETVIVNDIDLPHVAAETFIYQSKLQYLDLSYNFLHKLYNKSLHFHADADVRQLKLDGNAIFDIQQDAISGLKNTTYLWMQHNLLNDLPQDVWETQFASVDPATSLFVFDDNYIICECNLLWLVSNDQYMKVLAYGADCANTDSTIHDIDKDFLEQNC